MGRPQELLDDFFRLTKLILVEYKFCKLERRVANSEWSNE